MPQLSTTETAILCHVRATPGADRASLSHLQLIVGARAVTVALERLAGDGALVVTDGRYSVPTAATC